MIRKFTKLFKSKENDDGVSNLNEDKFVDVQFDFAGMNIENNYNNISSAAGGCLCNCPSYLHHIQKISNNPKKT